MSIPRTTAQTRYRDRVTRRVRSLLLPALVTALAVSPAAQSTRTGPAAPRGTAWVAVDLASGRVVDDAQSARLDVPVSPGSVMKIVALAAALESGVATARTGVLCAHTVRTAGHQLVCAHPEFHRPLTAVDALAHSCNSYFTTLAARIPRSAFDRVLADLGLPASNPAVPLTAVSVGVEGIRVAPRRLIDAVARIAADPSPLPWRPETLATVRDGLRRAATDGTAAALAAHGVDALAKTGTVLVNGNTQGLVVGVTPSRQPRLGFAMAVSGASGSDAAALVADRLARVSPPRQGRVRIGQVQANGRYRVTTMTVDDYVAGVIAGEASGSAAAALEALAITARTYTEGNRGRHAADGFDLCDLTHCQVLRAPTPQSARAATATTGQLLLDRGTVATVFYTASCGGHTEHPSAVWRGAPDPAHLPSRADDACQGAPAWASELTGAEVQRALGSGRFRGDLLRGITVAGRHPSGRVAWLRLDGLSPSEISGDDFRTLVGRTLGWQHVRSTWFDVTRTGRGFRFAGRGAGHGVGLCVLGSAGMAARGRTTTEILAAYFPGLIVGRLSADGGAPVQFVLPPSLRPREAELRQAAESELQALANRLGVTPPQTVTVRIHPTVESYGRETGQPWFTAGATTGATIDLVPLETLEARRSFALTLRHELVHVLTADRLRDRPLWVREGVAAWFAGEYADAAAGGPCPTDAELRRAPTPAALGRAAARARACVQQRIEAGADWRTLP